MNFRLEPMSESHRLCYLLACVLMLVLALLSGSRLQAAEAPKEPALTTWDVYTTASGLAVQDQYLYMTWPNVAKPGQRYLASIDISEPQKPVLLQQLPLDGFPQGIAAVKDHVLVVNGLELLVVNTSDPKAMRVTGRLVMAVDPVAGPQGIHVEGKLAYVACRTQGVAVVDISDLNQPVLVTRIGLPGFARDTAVHQGNLYVASDTWGVHILSLANPRKPVLTSRFEAPSGCVGAIECHAGTVYAAAGDVLVGTFLVTTQAEAKSPQTAWLGQTSDRRILSSMYGSYAYDLSLFGVKGQGIQPDKRYALVADGEAGLVVVDVTKPKGPVYAGALTDGVKLGGVYFATRVLAAGPYAYFIDQRYGLRVADISSPSQPKLAGEGVALTRSK